MCRSFTVLLISIAIHGASLSAHLAPAATADHPHSHGTHGPHQGELLEVGKGEYHVEMCIHEVKKHFVVYLFDKNVKSYVALNSPNLVLNLKDGGKPVQFKLLPMPQEIDQSGFSSRFGLSSAGLVDALHAAHADARLALRIGNKSYSVKIVHDHDHAGHDHASHDHSGQNHSSKKTASKTK